MIGWPILPIHLRNAAQLSRRGPPPALSSLSRYRYFHGIEVEKGRHVITNLLQEFTQTKPIKVSSSCFSADFGMWYLRSWRLRGLLWRLLLWYQHSIWTVITPWFLMHFGFILISWNSLSVSFDGSRSPICVFITCLLEFSAFWYRGNWVTFPFNQWRCRFVLLLSKFLPTLRSWACRCSPTNLCQSCWGYSGLLFLESTPD